MADDVAEPGPEDVVVHPDDDVPVGGAVRACTGRQAQVSAALRTRLDAEVHRHRAPIHQERDLNVEERQVDLHGSLRPVTLVHCGEYRDANKGAAAEIRDRDARPRRSLIRVTGQAHSTREPLDRRVVRGGHPTWPVVAEAAHIGGDHTVVDGAEGIEGESLSRSITSGRKLLYTTSNDGTKRSSRSRPGARSAGR